MKEMTNDELPEGWLSCSLGDVVDYGKTTKAEPTEIEESAWILELEDIEKDTSKLLERRTFADRQSKSTKNCFEVGDVLYGKLRPYLNKVIIADQPGYCTTEIIPLKPNTALEGRFLFSWLKHPVFLDYVSNVSHGLNMPRLGTDAGKAAPFILAPLAEQKRIADKLEAVLGRADACRARLDRVPDLLKRFRQSVLAAATSGQLTEDWREANKVSGEWQYLPLGDVVHNHDGKRVPISEDKRKQRSGNYPYYGAAGVIDRIDGYTHDGKFLMIGEDGANLLTRSKPNAFIASGKIWVNNHAHVLSCRGGAPEEFLAHFINSISLDLYVSGSAQPKLNQKNLNRIEVPQPTVPEQAEIVRRVEALFALADRIEARLATAQRLVERLTPATLCKAFRGDLVPQDPNDEPANALLERLRISQSETLTTKKPRQQGNGKSPRAPKETAAMTKSRFDEDVKGKPYLARFIGGPGYALTAEHFQTAQLSLVDFYKQLSWEVEQGMIKENGEELEVGP